MDLGLGFCKLSARGNELGRRRQRQQSKNLVDFQVGSVVIIRNSGRWFLCRLLERVVVSRVIKTLDIEWNSSMEVFGDGNSAFLERAAVCSYPMETDNRRAIDHIGTITLNRPVQMNNDFISVLQVTWSPLTSIVVQVESSLAEKIARNPILSSALKRSMVGARIILDESVWITQMTLNFQGVKVKLRVETTSSRQGKFHLILPSTKITLDTASRNKCSRKMPTTSTLSTIILDAVHAIRVSPTLLSNIPKTFLLSGPPGVGKTYLVRESAKLLSEDAPCFLEVLNGSEILSCGSESEAALQLQERFAKMSGVVSDHQDAVALIFLDECDALVTAELVAASVASLLDRVNGDVKYRNIVVVAATNRIDTIPHYLRRPGRFDCNVQLSPPNADERTSILLSILRKAQIPDSEIVSEEIAAIARQCVGYVAADLVALCRHACRLEANGESCSLSKRLEIAMESVGASALRESAMISIPIARWDDIAGDPGGAKSKLRQAIEWPQQKREAFAKLGLEPPKGILLYGPPGCAKTSLVRTAAACSGVAFLTLSPADVFSSSFVGEAESVVRRAFSLARSAAPCILFFDEIDAILGQEEAGQHGMGRGQSVEARLLSTFLNEMDGVDGSTGDGVTVIGATNRPWTLDTALLRKGRFDNVIYVPPPDEEERRVLFEYQCKDCASETIDFEVLASNEVSGNMTGAEIISACRDAAMQILRNKTRDTGSDLACLDQSHLLDALRSLVPMLSRPGALDNFVAFQTNGSIRQ